MKPTKEQLSKLSSHCMVHCDSAGWTMVRAEDLRALLDDYRARGEALRAMLDIADDEFIHEEVERALEGAGDES